MTVVFQIDILNYYENSTSAVNPQAFVKTKTTSSWPKGTGHVIRIHDHEIIICYLAATMPKLLL